jgi:hypothetical protein
MESVLERRLPFAVMSFAKLSIPLDEAPSFLRFGS